MKAAIYVGDGKFEMQEVSAPTPERPGDVVIKVLAASICGTDRSLTSPTAKRDMRGKILGHELVGEVAACAPDVTNVKVGDRVVVNPNAYCTVCGPCRNGMPNHCEHMELMGITSPGCFAEYVKSTARMVFKISPELELKYACFAEPLSCALNGFTRLAVRNNATVLVIGGGPIGLLFANMARLSGGRVVVMELKEQRRAIAEKCGFHTIVPGEAAADELKAYWGNNKRPEFIIDAAGGQLPVAIGLAEFCARILCFASTRTVSAESTFAGIQAKELNILGSYIIHDTMGRAVELLESRKMTLDPMITHELPLEELNRGMDLMRSGEGMEIILYI